jgi:hypothetical protein
MIIKPLDEKTRRVLREMLDDPEITGMKILGGVVGYLQSGLGTEFEKHIGDVIDDIVFGQK